ncbi:hypothetical protein FB446DRAFT_705441 [Lentinula raphanica]|nr:hypothetical protein FB446DRAFT_705441 [Lentinula raphanica]
MKLKLKLLNACSTAFKALLLLRTLYAKGVREAAAKLAGSSASMKPRKATPLLELFWQLFEASLIRELGLTGSTIGASKVLRADTVVQPAFDSSSALLEAVLREGKSRSSRRIRSCPLRLHPPLCFSIRLPDQPFVDSFVTSYLTSFAASLFPDGHSSLLNEGRLGYCILFLRCRRRPPWALNDLVGRVKDPFTLVESQRKTIPISDADGRVIAVQCRCLLSPPEIQTEAEEAASLLCDLRPKASFTNKL